MSFFDELIQNETIESVRAKVKGAAEAADLKITDWLSGGVGEQIFQAVTQVSYVTSLFFSKAVRGFTSLDTSTDPGDVDAFDDENVKAPPAAGLLSAFGQNTFGTTRGAETYATGAGLFVNSGIVPRTFLPGGLIFTWSANTPPSPAPTYTNAPDLTIYTNPDGSVTVGPGTSLALPIVANEVGVNSNVAATSSLSLTTTLLGCTFTNTTPVLAQPREGADLYRARCRQAPARVSLGGPADAYRYFATKNLDGTPLLNANGLPVGITRVYVSEDSATGVVRTFYAADGGPAISDDVTAANANIRAQVFAVPDAITFTGAASTGVAIHVAGSVRIKSKAGVTAAAVKAAIIATLSNAFNAFDIGGVDQVVGAGVIYTEDLRGIVKSAYPGLYDVVLTSPVAVSTALAEGQVATLTSSTPDWSVTLV